MNVTTYGRDCAAAPSSDSAADFGQAGNPKRADQLAHPPDGDAEQVTGRGCRGQRLLSAAPSEQLVGEEPILPAALGPQRPSCRSGCPGHGAGTQLRRLSARHRGRSTRRRTASVCADANVFT